MADLLAMAHKMRIEELKAQTEMEKAKAQIRYIVARVPEEDDDLLRYLVEQRILPGEGLVITELAPYRGVLSINAPMQQVVALGMEIASQIWVYPIENSKNL